MAVVEQQRDDSSLVLCVHFDAIMALAFAIMDLDKTLDCFCSLLFLFKVKSSKQPKKHTNKKI